MTISDSDAFNLVPMTGPAAQSDSNSMAFFSLAADTPLPSPELHPRIMYPTAGELQPDAIEVNNPETIAVNPNQPMKIGNVWLDGDVLAISCPECASTIPIRHWLMVADCWNCQTAVLLSADHEAAIEQLLRKTSGQTVTTPTAVPQLKTKLILPYFPAARKTEAHDRIRTTVVQEQPLLWFRRVFNHLPAWIVSLLAHVLLLILLGLLSDTDDQGDSYITLSVVVGDQDKVGGVTTNLTPDAETNYDLPPPDNIDPDDPVAVEKVEQDREIAEELQQDFDTNNPNLPDIDSVKKRINEATGTNKTILARDPRVRKQVVSREGGTSATEAAVARGLAWLAKHQAPNGNWSLHKFNENPGCTCENLGSEITDMGATSLALLPFLGAGQTHIAGKYKDHVRAGLDYLLDNRMDDGDLSFETRHKTTNMYVHGQATIVLCEALMMTGDRRLRTPAQEAVNFIVKAQHSEGGWRYKPGERGDTSVLGWQVMALQSAHAAGLFVPPQTLNLASQYLDRAQNPNLLYAYEPGGPPTHVMTAEALLCRFYLGYNQKSPGVEYGINYLVKDHMPLKTPYMYYMYYGTQLMHHYGGQPWKTWNAQMRGRLIASQETNGHRAGSWTPVHQHDRAGGRIFTTAMAVCCLEVYYRHLPIFRELELE